MNPIEVIIKEGDKLHFTFAKEAIRIKAPKEWLVCYEEQFIMFTRMIEPFVYENFKNTLRSNKGTINFDPHNTRLRFRIRKHRPCHKWSKTLIIKNGYVKVVEADKWNSKNILYRYFYRLYKGEN